MAPNATPVHVRFAQKIEACPMSGCWLWTDAPDRYGYGRLQIGRRAVKAHRLSHELHVGPIPAGYMVCHRCDTPACVNPSHLFAAPGEANVADMMAKGRFRAGGKPHPGQANPRAILSEVEAVELLLRKVRGEQVSPTKEARARGMNRSAIDRLLSGRAWRHLPHAEAALIARWGSLQSDRVAA